MSRTKEREQVRRLRKERNESGLKQFRALGLKAGVGQRQGTLDERGAGSAGRRHKREVGTPCAGLPSSTKLGELEE